MPFIQSIAIEAIRAILQIVANVLSGKDRRTIVLERRTKVLQLFKDLKAAGLRPRDLKAIEGTLTDEGGRAARQTVSRGPLVAET